MKTLSRPKARLLKIISLFFFALFISAKEVRSEGREEMLDFADFIEHLVNTTKFENKGSAICTFGNDDISVALNAKYKALNLSLYPEKYKTCKAVYIAQIMGKKILIDQMNKFHNAKIMTIGTFEGFTESGGMVEVQAGRRNFELLVNSKMIKESGILLNSLIIDLIIN